MGEIRLVLSKLSLGIFFFFLQYAIHAQATNDTLQASQYFEKADSLLTAKKYPSAITYFEKALPIYQKKRIWTKVASCYNKISESQRRNKEYTKSLGNAKKALQISSQYLPANNKEEADAYHNIGHFYYYGDTKDYKKALIKHQKALVIRQQLFAKDHLSIAESFERIGNTIHMQRKYNKALIYYQKALLIRKQHLEQDNLGIGNLYFNIGLTYKKQEKYDTALTYINTALSIREKELDKNHYDIALCNRLLGVIYRKKGEYDRALPYLEKYLSISMNLYGKEHHTMINALNSIGLCYNNKGEYDKALVYHQKASDVHSNIYKEWKPRVLNNIGVIYKYKGEYDKALAYYKKALDGNLKKRGEYHYSTAINYNNIGNIYRLKGAYKQSLFYYKKALAIRVKISDYNPSGIADSYNDIGELYTLQKEYDTAQSYINKALQKRISIYGDTHPDVANSYQALATMYTDKGAYKIALQHYQKALTIRLQVFKANHPKIAETYTHIARVYTLQKEDANALLYYQKALTANRTSNSTENPTFGAEQYSNLSIALTTLQGLAKSYTQHYQKHHNSKDLNKAIDTYQKATTIINTIRQGLTNYQDKVAFAKIAKDIYKEAIAAQLLLYAKNKDQASLEKAFYYAEISKANTLKELLADANAKNFTGLPYDLLELEKELRINRSFYRSKITEEQVKKESDTAKITRYENHLFKVNRRQDSLTQILEKKHPKYYQLKYKKNIVTASDIQRQLDDTTTLLEFFTADSITYAFAITKNSIAVQELTTPKLTQQIEKFRASITEKNTLTFKQQAHELYLQLIAPIVDQCIGDQLIIIPDGSLWHLNFELLLSKKDASNNPALLSYLLRNYAITYANAANLLFTPFRDKQKDAPLQECLAFSFSDSMQSIENTTMRLASLRDAGGDLPGTRKEIRAISEIIDGQYYFGSQAIEANFKNNANKYNILHLALHGEVDNEHPEYSKLYFTKNKDTIEDNLLYGHELFALDIPAELTVLSACNTGTGKIAKGEGIMSLGNAFQYAGTKSLLLTSWEVSDQTTPELMKYFYTYLKSGMNKGKALQQAKLQYLATANINRTAPFYWAGFYLVGDTAPMHFEQRTVWYWVLAASIVILISGLFWYRKKYKI
ncbi:CHAT domain-containing protein [Aquimarina aquimarini]|uniref:CHAT domain-containing protein n=2 Tax=Aquimarina aquimarini TaxID=1191734 RepID=UPI001F3173F3|nr:tetratricopeptide repeat protein [Aquimarina aquimarini]